MYVCRGLGGPPVGAIRPLRGQTNFFHQGQWKVCAAGSPCIDCALTKATRRVAPTDFSLPMIDIHVEIRQNNGLGKFFFNNLTPEW